MWKGRIGAIGLLVLLFASVATAAPVQIDLPESKTYTEDNSIEINITSDDGTKILRYEIPSAEINESSDSGWDSVEASHLVDDGEHRILAYWEENGELKNVSSDFIVDTKGPKISSVSPEGDVFTRSPNITAEYDDAVTGVNKSRITLSVDGEEITDFEKKKRTELKANLGRLDEEGAHNVSLLLYDNVGHLKAKTWSFNLPKEPQLSNVGPTGLVDGDSASLVVTAKDPSGIDTDASRFRVYRDGNEVRTVAWTDMQGGNTVTFSEKLTDLEDGKYKVKAVIKDNSSNHHKATKTWNFVVDTTPPELTLKSHSAGDIVVGEQAFVVKTSDDLSKVEKVSTEIDGEWEEKTSSTDGTFVVDFDTNEVGDGEQTLHVRGYDAAGNQGSLELNLTVDNSGPTVTEASVYPDTTSSLTQFRATVEEDVSGVENIYYSVRGEGLNGSMAPTDGAYDEGTEQAQATVDVSELAEDEEHTVYFRGVDGAGHSEFTNWAKFTIDTEVAPQLSISDLDDVVVEKGTSETVDVSVANSGDMGEVVSLSADSELTTSVAPDEKRVNPGETKSFTVTVEAADGLDLGPHPLALTAEGLVSSTSVSSTVHVQPTAARQQEIRSELAQLKQSFQELNESRNEYSGVVQQEDRQTFEETASAIQEIDALIGEDRYYRASQRLDAVDTKMSATETTVSGMVSRHKHNQLVGTVLKLVALLLLAGVAVGAYRMIPEEEGYDANDGFIKHGDNAYPMQEHVEQVQTAIQKKLAEYQETQEAKQREKEDRSQYNVDGWGGYGN